MRRVLSYPLLFCALIHGYIALRLIPGLAATPALGWCLGGVLMASMILVPATLRASRSAQESLLVWTGFLIMGLVSALLALTVCRDIALLAVLILDAHALPGLARSTAYWAAGGACVLALLGVIVARKGVRIARISAPVENLPHGLTDLRIVQISDMHVGPTIKRDFVARIVERVNRLRPDVIAITGDLVDGSVQQLSGDTAPLAALRARYGTYFVTGNHEYYAGARSWTTELRRLGLIVLKNQHVVIEHGGECLVLAGVNDVSAEHFDSRDKSDAFAAAHGAPKHAGARVLLAHQPRSAIDAERAGFDVQLSGHTHGGQFWPWSWLVRFFEPFVSGLNRVGRLWLYVSPGTGYWGPPMRFGARPEISVIALTRAA